MSILLILPMLFNANVSKAITVRLDRPGAFFADYAPTHQGALATCYAHPATALVDEFLKNSAHQQLSFTRASPLANSLNTVIMYSPTANARTSADAPINTLHVSRIEGGNVSFAAAAYLASGKRLDYSDLELKLTRRQLAPAGFSTTDLFGETLDAKYSACRFYLSKSATPQELLHLSSIYLPACEPFEAELARVGFVWTNPPAEFSRLKGIQFSAANTSSVPNLDAVRFLTLQYQSSYSSLYAMLNAFAHSEEFTPPDPATYGGLIHRYYFSSDGKSKKDQDSTLYIQEIKNPGISQLNQKMINHLNEGHPVSLCLDLNPLEKAGSIGRYYQTLESQKPKRHCMTLFGYRGPGDKVSGNQVSHYLVRNSWRHSTESRCSDVFQNRAMVACEVKAGMDTGNFWLNAQGMMEIVRHFGEFTLISPQTGL